MVPPAGIEPAPQAPQACILSIELRGHKKDGKPKALIYKIISENLIFVNIKTATHRRSQILRKSA